MNPAPVSGPAHLYVSDAAQGIPGGLSGPQASLWLLISTRPQHGGERLALGLEVCAPTLTAVASGPGATTY